MSTPIIIIIFLKKISKHLKKKIYHTHFIKKKKKKLK